MDLALSLVGSDDEVTQAMNYVFGSTLICKDPQVAKLVTFDKRVNLRSVTYDGDVYDPSGQLSGGAKTQSAGMLIKMQKLRELKSECRVIELELKKAIANLNEFETLKQHFKTRSEELELRQHELSLHEKRLSNNANFKLIQHVEEMIAEHKKTKELLDTAKSNLLISNSKVAEIEKEMEELNNNRESKVASLKKDIKQKKAKLEKLEPSVSKMQEEILLSKEEILQTVSEIDRINAAISALEKSIQDSKAEVNEIEMELGSHEVWNNIIIKY